MKRIVLSFFLALLFPLFLAIPAYARIPQTFKVIKVIDGQTIVADIRGKNETVKLLGISTPDTAQCFGKAADDKLKSLLSGKSVILVDDKKQGNRDTSGNLIRYVYLPDSKRTFINGEMIKQGYAHSNGQKTELLSHMNWLEAYAKNHSTGLWEACPVMSPSPTTKPYIPPQTQYIAPTATYVAPTTPPQTYQPPVQNSACAGATAVCSDGTCSYSAHHQGTCSHHGGVAQWL